MTPNLIYIIYNIYTIGLYGSDFMPLVSEILNYNTSKAHRQKAIGLEGLKG